MSDRIEKIREAVEDMHKCKAVHERSIPTVDMLGRQVWQGVVKAFALSRHPAKRCYAWAEDGGGSRSYIAVLELPPVDSPLTAVRAAIRSGRSRR